MIEHVTITAANFAASLAFYDAALGALGLVRLAELVDEEDDDSVLEAVGWGAPDAPASVWLVVGAPATSGLHLRLQAISRQEVETFHRDALRHGGSHFAAPRRWTPYPRGEFGAMVRDPAGNLIEAVAPE